MVKLDVKNDGKEVFTSKRSFSSILVEIIYIYIYIYTPFQKGLKKTCFGVWKGPAQKRLASQRCVLWCLYQFLG